MMRNNTLRTAFVGTLLTASAFAGVDRVLQGPAPAAATPQVAGAAGYAPAAASAARAVAARWKAPEDPRTVGMDRARLADAVRSLEAQVEREGFPGAALAVGRGAELALEAGVGRIRWDGDPVRPDSATYDIASLTKVVGTTTAAMLLVEDGRLELDAPVSRYLPEFSGGRKDEVTVRHLLTHTSGLPAGAATWGAPEAARTRLIRTPLQAKPGARVEYSDVGFVALWAAAEAAADRPLSELLRDRVFAPLGMESTTFRPALDCRTCAPTAWTGTAEIVGRVHDPTARKLGAESAGNAGLFSTARDLGRFAAMLANGGELDGVRVLREETVREFTTRQPGASTRALGWDTRDERGIGAAGLAMSAGSFGHTGFTGTSLWVDPERKTWTVLLTNRTYAPRATVAIQKVRRTVHEDVVQAADAVVMGD
ncbi:MAG: serine hydrolase domain-containing protein [Gemmatimonadota bacterium]